MRSGGTVRRVRAAQRFGVGLTGRHFASLGAAIAYAQATNLTRTSIAIFDDADGDRANPIAVVRNRFAPHHEQETELLERVVWERGADGVCRMVPAADRSAA